MDAKEDIKSRLSIEDVIGSYVELKRAGRNFKGLSPFNPEKTASFIVSPEKQIWHDFSSGKGGDMFSFVMEVEGLDFRQTLELLARRAGVDLEQYQNKSGSGVNKQKIFEILEYATKFYQVQLKNSKQSLDYLINNRKFTKQTILEWRIGYSPNNGDALLKFLLSKGFSEKDIKTAGLITTSYNRTTDMFRGRVMIPLCDSTGRTIGFTARQLSEEKNSPKYINTPQTILYDKSRHVFGLHLAKEAIRKNKYVVLVEGNLDVIMAHQHGTKQVVATAGTALTIYHLKALSRLTPDIRLCFDSDSAGINATKRAIEISSKEEIDLSIIDVEGAKDPDELIKNSPKNWDQAISSPIYAIDWLISYFEAQIDLNSAPGKRKFSSQLLPIINSISDDVEKDHYLNVLAKKLEVKVDSINSKMDNISTNQPKKTLHTIKMTAQIDKRLVELKRQEDQFLSLIVNKKTLREFVNNLDPEMFYSPDAKDLFKKLKKQPQIDFKKDMAHFKEQINYVKILLLLYEELYAALDLNEQHYEAAHLQARIIEAFVKNEKIKIADKFKLANEKETNELLNKARKLDQLLNKIKGEV